MNEKEVVLRQELQARENELWLEFERLCPDPKVKGIALELIATNLELEEMCNQ